MSMTIVLSSNCGNEVKLADLRELADSSSLNLEEAITQLEEAMPDRKRDLPNLSPWQKYNSRHKNGRPLWITLV